MAGGGGAGARNLDQTPTWAVAAVSAVIILISFFLEKTLHSLGEWFARKHKKALYEALEKVKSELMVLGFISLLLTFGQNYIIKICIPENVADTMLPCRLDDRGDGVANKRRLLWNSIGGLNSTRRSLAGASTNSCPSGKIPFVSTQGLHQLHIFIFFLAIFHVIYSALTMALGRLKIRRWKEWEKETQSHIYEFSNDPSRFRLVHETSFVKQHASLWDKHPAILYLVCFFHQFFRSVTKSDYLTMRHGFISVHLAPGSKFNFQQYIKRSLEDDFKVVVGISPILWAAAVIFLLLNVHGWQELFWVSLLPPIILLAVGTKLQAIIAKMAIVIKDRHAVVQGIPLVQLSDHHFWFKRPSFVLTLIHFTLFMNTFQLTYFVWIWYDFGFRSCFHENVEFLIARISIGVTVQSMCSYITLPLYALVSQMGSHMKRSIFDEQTNKALKKWHQAVRKRQKMGMPGSPSMTPSTSPRTSPSSSPVHLLHRFKTIGHSDAIQRLHSDQDHESFEMMIKTSRHISDTENSDTEMEYSTMAAMIPSFKHGVVNTKATELHLRIGEEEEEEPRRNEDFTFVKPPPSYSAQKSPSDHN
ncbi:MLO-like protein 8 [Apostasia shenzhenica]|uniref:MLO-like protein n=1 Tax=Apostasia shenzhenica TaxID=1088818 RepID=A0A2I0A989_9ASPA|nr:MLO-like protein 8 [Apostasia shenzhenica]